MDYVNLLNGLSEADSTTRKQAEEVYNTIPAKDKFSFLGAALCQKDLPQNARVFAAILLRRLVISSWTDVQAQIPPQQLLLSCNELLNVLRNSATETCDIRDKMCEVISAVAKNYLNEETQVNQWSEFAQFLFELFAAPQFELREAGFTIYSSAPDVLGQVDGQTAYMNQIQLCFAENLRITGQSDEFYASLVNAVAGLVIDNTENKKSIKTLSSLSEPLIELVAQQTKEEDAEELCKTLIEIAEEAPLFFRPVISQTMAMCIKFMNESDGLKSDLRLSALELAVTLIENAPNMIKRRVAESVKPIIEKILFFMASIEDDPDWHTTYSNEKDEDEIDAIGETALDRISNSLGGKFLLPIMLEQIFTLLNRPEWQARHAGLMALSCSGEGCRDEIMKNLDKMANGVIGYLDDQHPRCRYAACNTIGQMATDFAPEFEKKLHSKVIPALCRLLVDERSLRVQAHAACAMINFSEECPKEILEDYLETIQTHIHSVLSKYYVVNNLPNTDEGKLFVIESIIVALSSVADTSAELFVSGYDKFMPLLKYLIQETTGNEKLRAMRGKAIECVSLIGMAVGKEIFCKDATDIMQMLLATQTGDLKLSDDDPQLSYMMAAWARICRILGQEFKAYLPYVMPSVLKAASLKVEIAILNEEDREAIVNSSEWESVSVQDQAIGIRTAGLEDKATACSMLVCYARELKEGFVDYVEPTAEVLIPLLKFPFNDDVRCAASEAMPFLLESAKPKGEQYVMSLWNAMFENLVGALDTETDITITNHLLDSIAKCIETLSSIDQAKCEQMTLKLEAKLKSHMEYLAEEFERRKDEDYEPGSECSDDEDDDCLSGIASVLHALFSVHREKYLPYFQRLIEYFVKLSVTDQHVPWTNRQTAICVWDDVIEYTGQESINYRDYFLPLLTGGIVDQNSSIRQASLYGIGQLAQQNGATFIEYFQQIMPSMIQLITHPEARDDEQVSATENAISAIGRILRYCPQIPNHDELLKHWISWLPIWEDDAEVPVVMDFLLQLIHQQNPIVIGANSSNVPHLVAIVAETFARGGIDNDTDVGKNLVNFLKQIHSDPIMSACLSRLTNIQQKAVQRVLTS